MRGHGQKLDARQEALVAALLTEPTQAKAAEKAGVSEATLYRWLALPEFRTAYRQVRRQLVEGTVGRIQQVTCKAVETLDRLLTCGNWSVEIRAVALALDYAIRGLQVSDLLESIEALKAEMEELRHGPAGAKAAAEETAGRSGEAEADGNAATGSLPGEPVPHHG
jgi:transposase